MSKPLLFFVPLVFLAGLVSARQAATGENQDLPVGTIVPKVVTLAKPDQSYALYLPSKYSPQKKWPIIFAFDPSARGNVPVELMKDAAERHGYILAGSNNSRNGSWKIEAEAAESMLLDTEKRVTLDRNLVYFAGFSGGARVAVQLAQLCKCAVGVLLNGAGFQPQPTAAPDTSFAVFAAVGTYDFNYSEILRMDEALEKLRYPHFLRIFEGPHQWAPASSTEEALSWFRLQAMKINPDARDNSFAASYLAQELQRAQAFERSGDAYSAWKEYQQAARSVEGLVDNSVLRARADELERNKAVRDAVKREKQDFEDQDQLTHEISAELAAMRGNQAIRPEIRADLARKISDLHDRAGQEKRPERLRVLKRAVGGVVVQAVETGLGLLEENNPAEARDYFELASGADADSAWALGNLAKSRALLGERKGALDALRRAKSKSKDPDQFVAWIKSEPAFEKLRGTQEFSAIIEAPAQH